jgi:Ni/Co efflux regulator RcnB
MMMKRTTWRLGAWVLTIGLALTGVARADGHGKHDRDDNDDRAGQYYSDHDRDYMRSWYHDHDRDDHLPPGLAKRDQLPPGLERQLRVRGTLPPGLRKRMLPCPEEMERQLPPPPPGCAHVIIGGHVVLVNRSSYVVLDVFHFER